MKKLLTFIFTAAFIQILSADVKPSKMFGNNMVLQRDMPVPVWGNAAPGEKVTVEFAGQKKETVADENGKWMVKLDPMKASCSAGQLVISGKNSITFKGVLVGEVWVCSGQSNMQFGTGRVKAFKKLFSKARKMPIHTFNIARMVALTPQENPPRFSRWTKTPPPSAVAFGFAYYLQKSIKVPVGIILTCWGSSSIEGWMPKDMAETCPHFKEFLADFEKNGKQKIKKLVTIAEKKKKGERSWPRKDNIFARTRPNILYNAMMHPVIPYAVRGMVWYQGEANTKTIERELEYAESLQNWVKKLRGLWGKDDLYFLAVMLPGFGKIINKDNSDPEYPDNITWAWMRESQMKILNLPNTAVANTIDLGNLKNIHPTDKGPLTRRLALLAEKNVYGKNITASGPVYKAVKIDGNKMIVEFDNAEGLKTKDGAPPKGFWIAGKDQKWYKATASISGNKVILTSEKVDAPCYCRYAFSAKPSVNLVNSSGLPAYPFRTDKLSPRPE